MLPPTACELIERQCAEVRPVVRNAGLTLTSDPHDTEWKSRVFEVSDPSVLLTIFSETSASRTRTETPPTCDTSADDRSFG